MQEKCFVISEGEVALNYVTLHTVVKIPTANIYALGLSPLPLRLSAHVKYELSVHRLESV